MHVYACKLDRFRLMGSHVGPASARVLNPFMCVCVASSSVCACVGAKWNQTSQRVEQCCQRSLITALKKKSPFFAPPPPLCQRKLKIQIVLQKFWLPWKFKSLCVHLFSPKTLKQWCICGEFHSLPFVAQVHNKGFYNFNSGGWQIACCLHSIETCSKSTSAKYVITFISRTTCPFNRYFYKF